jgi:hypothetical protein
MTRSVTFLRKRVPRMSCSSCATLMILYFSPAIFGLLTRSRLGDADRANRIAFFAGITSIFLGWTVIGWIAAWAMLLSDRVGDVVARWGGSRSWAGGGAPGGATNYTLPPPAGTSPSLGSSERRPCSTCGGGGRERCPTCWGRGTWTEPPQGEYGVAQVARCTYCIGSGNITCRTCGGSGKAAF